MTFGEIIELIFGLAMTAFMLFLIFIIPFGLFSDSKKSRYRRRRRPAYRRYKSYSYTPPDFDYYHSYNKTEFLVYFIENENLDALKIGVGNGGRLLQLLNSYQEKNEESQNIGWKLLRLAKFSDYQNNYEIGKINGNEAEKKAHFYWRNVLKLPIYLSDGQLGYSKVNNYGEINWVLTKGFTETVQKSLVCEASTWNYVINSTGFINENNNFMGYEPRELKLLYNEHLKVIEPTGYSDFKLKQVNHFLSNSSLIKKEKSTEEKFWEKISINSDSCWIWTGSSTNKDDGYVYGLFSSEGRLEAAHRVAWKLFSLEDIANTSLENICGKKLCVNPEHWKKSLRSLNSFGVSKTSEFKCTTPGCERPSRAIVKASLCEPCRQVAKRKRRRSKEIVGVEEKIVGVEEKVVGVEEKVVGVEEKVVNREPSASTPKKIPSNERKISIYKCLKEDCNWPSSSFFESELCGICLRNQTRKKK